MDGEGAYFFSGLGVVEVLVCFEDGVELFLEGVVVHFRCVKIRC